MIERKKIFRVLWIITAICIVVLFFVAVNVRSKNLCNGIEVNIYNNNQNNFITKDEVVNAINYNGLITEQVVKNINTTQIENVLYKNAWVKNVEVYFDNNNNLQVDITQRKPIARLITVNGVNYYIDELATRLPVKKYATARVLVVTGFTSDNETLAHVDSMLLQDVKAIVNYINKDSFLNAQISQINITSSGKFELFPNVGNHIINFGDATDIEQKFDRLLTFYKQAFLQTGINTYEMIDVRFNNQVVATKRGAIRASLNTIDTTTTLLPIDSTTILH